MKFNLVVANLTILKLNKKHYIRINRYQEFQKYILSLFDRGIILAINSKNNINKLRNIEKPFDWSSTLNWRLKK